MIGTVMGASRMEVGEILLVYIYFFLPSSSGKNVWKAAAAGVKMSFSTLFLWNFHPSGFFTLISMGRLVTNENSFTCLPVRDF